MFSLNDDAFLLFDFVARKTVVNNSVVRVQVASDASKTVIGETAVAAVTPVLQRLRFLACFAAASGSPRPCNNMMVQKCVNCALDTMGFILPAQMTPERGQSSH